MTWDQPAVEAALRRVGLDPGAFDLDQVATQLETLTAMSESLVASIGDGSAHQPPTVFDPRWPA